MTLAVSYAVVVVHEDANADAALVGAVTVAARGLVRTRRSKPYFTRWKRCRTELALRFICDPITVQLVP